jgi:sn-glycerol 3-phosphate transport system substrate-binding protein
MHPARRRLTSTALVTGLALTLALTTPEVHAATEIALWHSVSGPTADAFQTLVNRFNRSQPQFKVVPLYKGAVDTTLAIALAAGHSSSAPDIVQADVEMTASLLADRSRIRPLHEVLKATHEAIDSSDFLPGIASYLGETGGRLDALPFTPSTAVLYINRDALRRAELPPEVAPRTWRDVQAMTLAVQARAAAPCGYTSDWQSWVHVENLGAWHDEAFASRSNGMDGLDPRLTFNTTFMLRHVSLLSAWARSGLFTYHGRGNQAETHFVAGECALFTGSSNSIQAIRDGAGFDFAVAPLPFYDEYPGAPFRSTIGGTALWTLQGRPVTHQTGAARFLKWLAQPEQQAAWHQATGFLPLSHRAVTISRQQGFYQRNPGFEVAISGLAARAGSRNSRGVRLPQLARIRAIIDEELEQVWAHTKAPKDALDAAVARGNQVLRFAR